jgi:hypothetical protein
MAVTAVQIADYLDDIYEAQSKYMDKLVRREKFGHTDIYSNRVIAAILNCYITVVTDYFSQPVYSGGYFLTTYNFFDEEEIKDVIYRINKICDTDYYLDI